MFGFQYIKTQPTTYLMQFRNGRVVREGAGVSFFYYAMNTTLVLVPIASRESHFMLELVTSDFQEVTVQGQVSYRVRDPKRTAALLDFSLQPSGKHYASEDPQRLGERVSTQAKVIVQQAIQALNLGQALNASEAVASRTHTLLSAQVEVAALGLEILGVSIIAIKPTPDIARALEAQARESNLKKADEAIYMRRMASVQNERAIRENELDTEVAVELKKRQIQEAQLDAQAAVLQRQNALRREQMSADVALEQHRKDLVSEQATNARTLADAQSYQLESIVKALAQADPRVVQALTAAGMQPAQLIAQAFGGIAERADRIGQLSVSPELLQSLLSPLAASNTSALSVEAPAPAHSAAASAAPNAPLPRRSKN